MNRRDFLISTSLLSLCMGGGLSSAAHASEGEAVIVLGRQESGSANYDPIRSVSLNMASALIYDRLVEQDPGDQSYHPHLAQYWETSQDGLTWTFKLRQGVTFHDGEPFNAATIAWWIPKFAGTENEYMTSAIDHVEVVDDHTVRFLMKRPEPNLIYNLASVNMGVPSPKSYDAAGDGGYGVIEAVGTGPYKLESFVVSQETVLVANGDYAWSSDLTGGTPNINRLTMREIPDASTAFLELKTGGVDLLLDIPTDFLPQLKAQPEIEFRELPSYGVTFVAMNTRIPIFSDMRVRQATALAIDQGAILKSVYGGAGKEAHQFLVGTLAEAKVDPTVEIHHDAAKAGKLLDEAGWAPGGDGIRVKDGKPMKVKLWARADTEYRRMAEIIQAQLKAVGMAADITIFDEGTYRAEFKKKDRELVIEPYSWTNADILDSFFSAKFMDGWNLSSWDDAKSEELNERAMHGSATWEERVANFKKYHENLLANFLGVPIHEPAQTLAFNSTRLSLPDRLRMPLTMVDMIVK
ncbi:ABC transporter substrate-binding protein [Mesorhizobium sp. INR15]|uniref:ABC transporter substrate-binding protein n=1 Tax=Mesorhizobium sp. INR15 TaxID=2654248 RepID=UPI0018969730|nr:ABC transporter substrate-binding protein [Mesorhizobium sp. INR15]QPC93559.1 ABC transporter substrate-binding protein [Mesorhizobium sp. INR15]